MTDRNTKWMKTTCKKARKYLEMGAFIWWRPNGTYSKTDPDNDEAWVML